MIGTTGKKLSMFLFFVGALGVFLWVSSNRPKIMVLHSYDEDYIWTTEVNVGLERILAGQSWLRLEYYYMKTKKSKDKDYLRRAGIAARRAIDNFQPDVLISIDDSAQELAAMAYVDDPGMAIVFAGVNGGTEAYGYPGAKNVTGILERKPVVALVEMLQVLHRQQADMQKKSQHLRVRFLADNGHSARRDAEYLAQSDWGAVQYLGATHVDTFAEWQVAIKQLGSEVDYLLVGAYRKLSADKGGQAFVNAKDVISWTDDNSAVPMVGMNVFCCEDGTMLSVGISPYEQGEYAANTALNIIRKQLPVAEIPVRLPQQYIVAMRKSALEKRLVEMPKIYEAFARAANYYYD